MIRLFLRCALIAALTSTAARAEIYLWPLHGPRRLSSSFGEYRSGHYHAGIDLRTGGRIGLPCRAIGNGWVSRLKIGPYGYGRALYLRLDDGRTAVYAHLEGFTRSLDSLAHHRRLESKSSWCDIRLRRGRWRVETGDTICWSGVSGTGAPHLHFELRDEGGRPINPLGGIYAVPDASPPFFSGLRATPAAAGSRVDGRLRPVERLFRARGQNFFLPETLQVEGTAGFAVSVWDEQGYGRHPMAPARLEFLVDGALAYLIENRRFSYRQSGEIVFEVEVHGDGPAGRYTILFRRPGVTRSDRAGAGFVRRAGLAGDGLPLETGLHRGEIIAVDAAGNESVARFVFALHDLPVVDEAAPLESGTGVIVSATDPDGGTVDVRLWGRSPASPWRRIFLSPLGRSLRGERRPGENRFRLDARDDEGGAVTEWFTSSPPVTEPEMAFCELSLEPVENGIAVEARLDGVAVGRPVIRLAGRMPVDLARTGERSFETLFSRAAAAAETVLVSFDGRVAGGYPVETRSAARALLLASKQSAGFEAGQGLALGLRAAGSADTAVVVVAELPLPGAPPPGLQPVGDPFSLRFLPWRVGELELSAATSRRTGLFRWDETRGWRPGGVPAASGGLVSIARPGVYALFADSIPPLVKHVAVEKRPVASGFYRSTALYAAVEESGCGIDPFSATATIDGMPAVCEWDHIRERLYILLPADHPGGPVTVVAAITDHAGNRGQGRFGLTLEPAAERMR